jgi:hypothetical protein
MLCDLKIGYGQTLVLTGGSAVKQSLVRACHMLVICIAERRISDCCTSDRDSSSAAVSVLEASDLFHKKMMT